MAPTLALVLHCLSLLSCHEMEGFLVSLHHYTSVHIHHARAVRILISQHQSGGRVTELVRVTVEGGNSKDSSLFSISVPCTPAATLHGLPRSSLWCSSLRIRVSPPLPQEFMPILFIPSCKVLLSGTARTSVICQISHDRDSCLPVIQVTVPTNRRGTPSLRQ